MPRREIRFHLGEAFVRFRHVLPEGAMLSGDGSELYFAHKRDLTDIEVAQVRQFFRLAYPRLPINRLPRRRNADRRLRPIT